MNTVHDAAARHLLAARNARRPGARLPESCRPATLEDALAIQRQVTELLGEAIGGWKCSLPGSGKLIVGPIYAPTVSGASPYTAPAQSGMVRIEPEIAYVLGADLPPRDAPYTEAEVRAAVKETRAVLEVLGSRYADRAECAFPEMLADGLQNYGLFVGPVVPDELGGALSGFPVTVQGPAGEIAAKQGKHPDGYPLAPLHWLANFLAGRGEMLRAGQVVTTGSYCGVLEAPVATPLSVTYGGVIGYSVEFRAEA